MLGLALLASCVVWGFALLRLCGVELFGPPRVVAGMMAGLVTGFWGVFLLASSRGELTTGVLVSAIALLVLGSAAARMRPAPRWDVGGWFWGLVAFVGGGLAVMNLWGVLARAPDGSWLAQEHVWADAPLHASLITNFVYRPNFPPSYPLALGQRLAYPFLADFATAALIRGGLGLRAAWLLWNVAVQTTFFAGVAAVTHRLTGSRRTAILATMVFFTLGNLGFWSVPHDIRAAGGLRPWLGHLPWSYTGDALGGPGRERLGIGMYLGNPVLLFFMPERSSTFGLAAGAALLCLLDELARRARAGTAVVAGLILGVTPRIHAHTVMAAIAFGGAWYALGPARKGLRPRAWPGEWLRTLPCWLLAGGIALAVALPQLEAIGTEARGFVSWWPGWTGEAHDALARLGQAGQPAGVAAAQALRTLLRFWILNAGLLAILVFPAFRRAPRDLRVWYAPFIVLWVFANVVKTQPWEWDNNNHLLYWQLGTTVLVAPYLASLLSSPPRLAPLRGGEWRAAARFVAGVACVAGLTVGGLLSLVYAGQQRHQLWTPQEVAFAERVRALTAPDAVILTANGHTHPVLALSGRQGFAGFGGWIWAHGLDWSRYEAELRRMLVEGDVGLMRRLGITHVVIGPWEEDFARQAGASLSPVFSDAQTFRELRRQEIGGREWRLLELR